MSELQETAATSHPSDHWSGRFATGADAEGILDLLVETFGSWPLYDIPVSPLEHLRWKFFAREVVRRQQIVIDDGDRIVGLNGFFRQWIKVKGQLRHAHQVLDLAVLPDYQSRGVMSATRRFAVSDRIPDCDVLFGPQGRAESREKIRRTGRWDPAIRPATYLQVFELQGAVVPANRSPGVPWQLCSPSRFDSRVRSFWEEASEPFDLIPAHEEEFLNWRFCDPRAGGWTLRTAEQDGKLLGYITYRESRGTAHVGGLLALPDRLDVVEGLVATMADDCARSGARSVQCWSTAGHPYMPLLTALGLHKKRRHLRFTIHAENEDFSHLEDRSARIHISAGDADLI